MKRRDFISAIGTGALALASKASGAVSRDATPKVAITIDDFKLLDDSPAKSERRHQAILDALRKHHNLKAAGFICGRYVESDLGRTILKQWDEEGHIIANHTYSHWYYHNRGVSEFTADILRCEAIIQGHRNFRKLFRFPMLKEGNTKERRDQMRGFLKQHGYKHGYVTIDASDWYVDGRLNAKLASDPKADVSAYRRFYLDHVWDRATYYDGLARKVLGRAVKHTLLIHHSELNGLFLSDLLTMFEQRGWALVNAEESFSDSVFSAEPDILPAGESIVWALAKESKKFEGLLRYPGEDGEYEKPKMDRLGL